MPGDLGIETRSHESTCLECHEDFAFEQTRFGRGAWLPHPPKLCDGCVEDAQEEARQEEERAREERARERREERRQKIHELLDASGASPWEHGHCTLANFDDRESGAEPVEAAREFVGEVLAAGRYDPVRGLYLHGTTGSGKSHLATAVSRSLLLEPSIDPASVVFDPADVLASRIRSMYGGRGDVDGFLQRRERSRVWILDDMGREPPHPDVVGHLTMLISQRAMRPTVITGNLAPNEYEGRHPDLGRIGSRLGPAYFRTVKVTGRDRRFDEQQGAA